MTPAARERSEIPEASGATVPLDAWAGVAIAGFCGVALGKLAWAGQVGVLVIAPLVAGAAAYAWARRRVAGARRARWDLCAKALFTVLGFVALLRHPIELEAGTALPVYAAIGRYVATVDAATFGVFAAVAMVVKFGGVIASAFGWHLLLVGQGIRFPFWSTIMTSFLIGRFIGTFLPSTLGLDGYTLFEASRYSNEWSRAMTAKALEKIVGITGLFLGMAITLPFGYAVIVDVTTQTGRPEAAPLLAAGIGSIAGGIALAVVATLARPGWLTTVVAVAGRLAPLAWTAPIQRIKAAVGAYRGQFGLLLGALLSKFVAHFSTASVYYFTALAIGVTTAAFWPIAFGSTIQILATLLSPTIAGEGAREAFQALLLSQQLGGVAQAVLSAALGFVAAEAATLWGGAFLWTRTPDWRPRSCLVDGRQVDYGWLAPSESAAASR